LKFLLYISVILAGIVAFNELDYLDKSSLGWVILGLAISIGLIAIYLISEKNE